MSNNPTPPRIEREARKQAFDHYSTTMESEVVLDDLSTWGQEMKSCYYIAKRIAFAEFDRAAPVVKALYVALGILELNQIEPEMAEEFRKILQTYKSDV